MPKTWIFVDSYYLAHRAFHSTGGLSYNGVPTGVIYGFLREIKKLENDFGSRYIAFAFDSIRNVRRENYPWYKNRVQPVDAIQVRIKRQIHDQIKRLWEEILPDLGYGKNLFRQDGYEGDDIICSLVNSLGVYEKAIMVSADGDLYQLLSDGVTQYRPNNKGSMMSVEMLDQNLKVTPQQWPIVKSICGCKSDTIPGLNGVGEVFASRFISGRMEPKHAMHKSILDWMKTEQYEVNLKLIRLPYAGCQKWKPVTIPATTEDAWQKVYKKLGISSLEGSGVDAQVRMGIRK